MSTERLAEQLSQDICEILRAKASHGSLETFTPLSRIHNMYPLQSFHVREANMPKACFFSKSFRVSRLRRPLSVAQSCVCERSVRWPLQLYLGSPRSRRQDTPIGAERLPRPRLFRSKISAKSYSMSQPEPAGAFLSRRLWDTTAKPLCFCYGVIYVVSAHSGSRQAAASKPTRALLSVTVMHAAHLRWVSRDMGNSGRGARIFAREIVLFSVL